MGKTYIVSPPKFVGRPEMEIVQGIAQSLEGAEILDSGYEPRKIGVSTFYDHMVWGLHQCEVIKSLLVREFEDDDHLIFGDWWFPGLEMLYLAFQQKRKHPTLIGFVHGASFVDGDLFMHDTVARSLEAAWAEILDRIWVQTPYTYHKAKDRVSERKLRVVGSPFTYTNFLPFQRTKPEDKMWDIVFPHRFTHEKGFHEFLELARAWKDIGLKVLALSASTPSDEALRSLENAGATVFYHTTGEDFYKLLARCRVAFSCAPQETFGYAMLEAAALGCVPLVPDRACYPYIYPPANLYKSIPQAFHVGYRMAKEYPANLFFPKEIRFHGGRLEAGEIIQCAR